MRAAILQINPLIAAPEHNAAQLAKLMRQHATGKDLFITPELALTGYPPQDVLSDPLLLGREAQQLEGLRILSEELKTGLLIGHTEKRTGRGRPLYNSASLYDSGQLLQRVRKMRLPSYDIFEEDRFFEAWSPQGAGSVSFRGLKLGIAICEDSWDSILAFGRRDVRNYSVDSNPWRACGDADVLINLSASPYSLQKRSLREDLFKATAARFQKPLIYANCVGAQDALLFDGASYFVDSEGAIIGQGDVFSEDVVCAELTSSRASWKSSQNRRAPDVWRELAQALVVGIRDYVSKTGHQKVVLGLSGGIDSTLVAALAARALGPANVLGVSLPSVLTSDLSKTEAREVATRLGIEFREISIADSVAQHVKALSLPTSGLPFENLQSRNRGILLMALSNAEKRLLLATGNKSELAVGYATLYGDMCGALLPIGDLYKTEVYGLAHFLCAEALRAGRPAPIPTVSLTRAPTAELAPGQKDSDSLPSYEALDAALADLIENQGQSTGQADDWTALLAPHTLASLSRKMQLSEFKRQQSAPILRVHQRAFGKGWKMPLARGIDS